MINYFLDLVILSQNYRETVEPNCMRERIKKWGRKKIKRVREIDLTQKLVKINRFLKERESLWTTLPNAQRGKKEDQYQIPDLEEGPRKNKEWSKRKLMPTLIFLILERATIQKSMLTFNLKMKKPKWARRVFKVEEEAKIEEFQKKHE